MLLKVDWREKAESLKISGCVKNLGSVDENNYFTSLSNCGRRQK